MRKRNANLSNPGVMLEHVSRSSHRYVDDLVLHRSEMVAFPAGFDSRTCTSRLAFFGTTCPLDAECLLTYPAESFTTLAPIVHVGSYFLLRICTKCTMTTIFSKYKFMN